MEEDLSLLEEHLRDGTLGYYKTNLALILLARHASFFLRENEPTLARWCVFAHEYAHFLHNFSTVAGMYDFIAHLRLTRLFVRTVGTIGTSSGSQVLQAAEIAEFAQLQTWRRHLRGDARCPFDKTYHRREVKTRVTGVKKFPASVALSGQVLAVDEVTVAFKVRSASTEEEECLLHFGSWHIMEALAYEIERIIFIAFGSPPSFVDAHMPAFPYKLGRQVFEHISQMEPAAGTLARICVMALQSSDPGAAFFDLATAFANRPTAESEDDTLGRLVAIMQTDFNQRGREIIATTLRPEFDVFASRGAAGRAIAALGDACCKYVELRTQAPFFEVELFERKMDRDVVLEMLRSFPPCPVVHEAGLTGEGLEYFNLSEIELDPEFVGNLGAYHSMGQFMLAHLASDRFLRGGSAC